MLSFLQFLDFQIGKTQSSQEFSTRDLDNSTLIVVYFEGYLSKSCTFVHFREIFNFAQLSQHICHFAEFLSSFMKKRLIIQIFIQKDNFSFLCKNFVNILSKLYIEVSDCCRTKHFNDYNGFETAIFSLFHA